MVAPCTERIENTTTTINTYPDRNDPPWITINHR